MKILKVRVSNQELNALEDLLYCVLNKRQDREARKKACKLWGRLVAAWDKQSK